MSNVSRNIKKLRLAAKMTQDELGERLHVTRQAVSNWENGRTQPDLEMLRNIANVFVTDEMELIYGKKSTVETLEAYPQNRGLRIRITALFGGLAILFLLIRLMWLPGSLVEYSYYRFLMVPVYTSVLLVRPLLAASICLFLLSLLSVWKDIRIKNRIPQRLFLVLSIVCILSYYGLFLLVFYGGGTLQLARFLWGFSVGLFINPEYIFSLVGITAFLGVNR